jgi:hypothetical protein
MRLTPALASMTDVNTLSKRIAANDARQAKAEAANSRAINRLAKAQGAAVKRLSAEQVRNHAALTKAISDGDARLEKRLTNELRGKRGTMGKQRRGLGRALRTQQQRSLMNAITIAVALPFVSAYGTRGDLLSKNNLIIGGSTLGWVSLEELIERFSGKKARAGWLGSAAGIWSYAAPVANALTIWLFLRNEQHERFVTGVSTVDLSSGIAHIDIPVGTGYQEEFNALTTDIPAVATPISLPAGMTGIKVEVVPGTTTTNRRLQVTPIGTSGAGVELAWIVDVTPVTTK